MSTTIPPLPSEVLAKRVIQLRSRLVLTQDELAARMQTLGYSWVRSTIAKIELGSRQVSVDELCALAIALGVPPIALLVPPSGKMKVTPAGGAVDVASMWVWATGDLPLPQEAGASAADLDSRTYEESLPDFCSLADRRVPGISDFRQTMMFATMIAGAQPGDRIQFSSGGLVEILERLKLTAQYLVEIAGHLPPMSNLREGIQQ